MFAHRYTGQITLYRANRLESVRQQPDVDNGTELVLDLAFGVVTARTLRRADAQGARA